MEIPFELVEAKRFVELGILALPGVTGISLGMREENGELFDELAVRIWVADAAAVPEEIPAEIAGVPICIVEQEYQPCSFPDTARYPDIRGGIKILHPLHGNGTLGAVVADAGGKRFGLTCQHCVGDPGSSFPASVWQPVSPPLPIGVTPARDDHVGEVERSDSPRTQPLPFSPVLVGLTDSALVRLDDALAAGRQPSPAIADQGVGQPNLVGAVTATALPQVGTPGFNRVRKRGFVTGPKSGTVIARHASLPWPKVGSNKFILEQWEINGDTVFALEGDSGSLVLLESSPTAVGLLWAGTKATQFMPEGKRGIMSEIGNVESQLQVSVVLP